MADPLDDTTTLPQPPTLASPYSAMNRALDMAEISYLIRHNLQGTHLKSAVLVCKLWWRLFAPYLWERVFIDANLDEKDREVLVRNGLAARSLTLSIYDPEDREGIVGYVVERCRNVEALHLKLFSPDLVLVDGEVMERRLREAWENDGAEGKDDDQERQFGIRSECKTSLLDSLLSKLPYVSELTLSIAHEDLRPEVLWCVPTLTSLRRLTIVGGLCSNGYIVHKNRLCDWDVILRTSRECKYLNSLSVSWESHKTQDANLDGNISKVSEMFETLEIQESSATGQEAPPPVPKREQFPSLRTLAVSSCEMHLFQMDFFYRSCPNLRAVEFKSVQASTHIMEKNLKSLALSCPNLLSFKLLDACKTSDRIDYSTSLLASPRTGLHSLTLSVIANATATVFGNEPPADNGYAHTYYKDDAKWTPPLSVTSLNVRDIKHPTVLLDIITSTPAGLTHLTIDGYVSDKPYNYPYYYYNTPLRKSSSLVNRLYKLEKNPVLRLPTFACGNTLEYLDISTLDVSERRNLYKILFWRIQELKGLRFLKMGREHVLAANLEWTWSDDTLVGKGGVDDDDGQTGETPETAMTVPDEGEDENNNYNHSETIEVEQEEDWEPSVDQDREKIFVWFPTVEHLYLVDTESRRYHSRNPFLTQHQASALVRMMPRLKVMSFNREDAKAGLEDIIEACPKVSFNFMMRQK
ncbi:hypothetical protein K457DRAFT_893298 [Linnemannia elongata AG-77]|uniref:F-box domain-containing protein n=1 Tax=Linnemannia elongata AG-77 TaxID=1314771 RepID=A0A197JYF4_9FUNG|nr:hypothetical protein K457DRAFT_893298 [Linnemannia elongata AG-77]